MAFVRSVALSGTLPLTLPLVSSSLSASSCSSLPYAPASLSSPFSSALTSPLSSSPLSRASFSSASFSSMLARKEISGGDQAIQEEMLRRLGSKDVRNDEVAKDPNDYILPHPLWDGMEVDKVSQDHVKPEGLRDKMAYGLIQSIRLAFDVVTGYKFGTLTPKKWTDRIIFLETVAGVPGSAASVIRHLDSLRRLKRDHGWIHTLMEEAENERMHLMTFLEIKQPGVLFRGSVAATQFFFWNFYFTAYLISPKFCHKMVGYLEEEAVATYTKLVDHLEEGRYEEWQTMKPPPIAMKYWKLDDDATMIDLVKVIRADEAHHRDCNHLFATMDHDDQNPIAPGH